MSDVTEPSPSLRADKPVAVSAQALADRNTLAAIAVERTRMPMVITDPRQADNPIVLANKAFLKLTGYRAEEVLGRNCRFLQGKGTSRAAIAAIREALEQDREIDIEILNYRKDGSPFWNQLGLSPVHDEDGELLYIFASQIDVTELRKVQGLEAAEHRLLKEVDHRARNVLAIVDGIVRLSRSDNPKRYAASIQQRVQALALAHSLLAERGWQEIGVEQVIRQQIEPFSSPRVRLAGPDLGVPANMVQPLSLVIHELVNNAVAHGALSAPEGVLDVRWEGGPTPGAITLRWEEVGGPAPSRDPPAGYGMAIMRGMIERQLRGSLSPEWNDTGLTLLLSLPGPQAWSAAHTG